MADSISKTGKWIDSQSGAVVDSEPAEGRLLVAPGGIIDGNVQHQIDIAAELAPPSTDTTPDPDDSASDDDDSSDDKPAQRATAAKKR